MERKKGEEKSENKGDAKERILRSRALREGENKSLNVTLRKRSSNLEGQRLKYRIE